jgi:hypothetical protein
MGTNAKELATKAFQIAKPYFKPISMLISQIDIYRYSMQGDVDGIVIEYSSHTAGLLVGTVVSTFATPAIGVPVGMATKFVVDEALTWKLKGFEETKTKKAIDFVNNHNLIDYGVNGIDKVLGGTKVEAFIIEKSEGTKFQKFATYLNSEQSAIDYYNWRDGIINKIKSKF